MATRKKHTPNVGWNPQSPPGMHKATRNLREMLKTKNPEAFSSLKEQKKAQKKVAAKVSSQVGPGMKTGEAVSKPTVLNVKTGPTEASVKKLVKSLKEKISEDSEGQTLLEATEKAVSENSEPQEEDPKPKKKRGRPRKKKSSKTKSKKEE